MEKPAPDIRSGPGVPSAPLADVDEVLDTTEAFWAARKSDNSRVRRLTCRGWGQRCGFHQR